MSASVARVGEALRVGQRGAWLVVLVGLCGVVGLAALATRLSMLPIALGLVSVSLLALVSLRWPLLSLVAFVALIPIEAVVIIDGFGTISRFAGILFAVTYGVPRLGRLAFGAMPPAAWAYVALSILSLGWAIDPNTAWADLPTLLQLFVIAILVADVVVQRPAIVRLLLWVYGLSAAATALAGILSYSTHVLAADGRAAAFQNQNPAQFAAILLPAVVFGLYEMLDGNRRILGGGVALLTTVGVVVSGTRGAWLSVLVALLLFILPRLRLRRQILAIVMIVLIGVVTLQLPGISELVAQRVDTAVTTGGAGRADIWSVALTIYGSAPVLGVGYANFPVAYTPAAVWAANVSSYGHLGGAGPHNLVIGTLIELGPLGLLLLALFLGPLVLRRGWGPDAAIVQAALASLLTMALFLDIVAHAKQVWLVIALSAGLAFVARRNRLAALDASTPAESAADSEQTATPGAYVRRPAVASVPGRSV